MPRTHPAWYHNIVANPDVTVELGTDTRPMRARVAGPDERERIWVDHKQNWPQFQEYEDKTDRTIPVVILPTVPLRDTAPVGAPCWIDLLTSDPDRVGRSTPSCSAGRPRSPTPSSAATATS